MCLCVIFKKEDVAVKEALKWLIIENPPDNLILLSLLVSATNYLPLYWVILLFFFSQTNMICVVGVLFPLQHKLIHAEGCRELCLSVCVSSEGNVSEIAEELVFLHPVHLWCFLLFFGMDLHLLLCCCSAQTQAHLSKRVRQLAILTDGYLHGRYYGRWEQGCE